MTKQSNDEKPASTSYAEYLAAMEKRLGVKEVKLPKGWAMAVIPPPRDRD